MFSSQAKLRIFFVLSLTAACITGCATTPFLHKHHSELEEDISGLEFYLSEEIVLSKRTLKTYPPANMKDVFIIKTDTKGVLHERVDERTIAVFFEDPGLGRSGYLYFQADTESKNSRYSFINEGQRISTLASEQYKEETAKNRFKQKRTARNSRPEEDFDKWEKKLFTSEAEKYSFGKQRYYLVKGKKAYLLMDKHGYTMASDRE